MTLTTKQYNALDERDQYNYDFYCEKIVKNPRMNEIAMNQYLDWIEEIEQKVAHILDDEK